MSQLYIVAETDAKTVFHKPENLLITLRSLQTQQCTTFTLAIKISKEPIKRRADLCESTSSFYLTPYSELDDTGVKPGRKRNRRRDRSCIGLKELKTVAPRNVPFVSFARTNGFLYRVSTAGGQTIGRTKQNYGHLQSGREYVVDLSHHWEVEGVRLETPVSSRDIPYRIHPEPSVFLHDSTLTNQISASSHPSSIPKSLNSKLSMFPQPPGIFNLPEDAQYFNNYHPFVPSTHSTSFAVDAFPQNSSRSMNPLSSPTFLQNQTFDEKHQFESYDRDEVISLTSTASGSPSSNNSEDCSNKAFHVFVDTTDSNQYRQPPQFYSSQDPLFELWNSNIDFAFPTSTPLDPSSYLAESISEPSHAYFDDSHFVSELPMTSGFRSIPAVNDSSYDHFMYDCLVGGTGEIQLLNVDSIGHSTLPDVRTSGEGNVEEIPNNSTAATQFVSGSCSSTESSEGSQSDSWGDDTVSLSSEQNEIVNGISSTSFVHQPTANASNTTSEATVSTQHELASLPIPSAGTAADSTSIVETSSNDSTCYEPVNSCPVVRAFEPVTLAYRDKISPCHINDDSSPKEPRSLIRDAMTNGSLSICHAGNLPEQHWQSLFFMVWTALAQMEASIFLSSMAILLLVQRHSSRLSKTQLQFLYSFHLNNKVEHLSSFNTVELSSKVDDEFQSFRGDNWHGRWTSNLSLFSC